MDTRKEINIREPIWKSRSVGLNVSDCNPETVVEITIDYKNKEGKLLWPKPFEMLARDIFGYPTQHVRGVTVHIVPINKLVRSSINNQKEKIMFDKKTIEASINKSKEQRGSGKKALQPGKHMLTLIACEEKAARDGNPMVVVHVGEVDGETKPIKETFKLDGPNTEGIKDKFIRFFHRSFDHEMKPAKDMKALMTQIKKFEGKEFGVVIRGKKKLIEDNGSLKEIQIPEMWYTCSKGGFDEMGVDNSKLIVELDQQDKARLVWTVTGAHVQQEDVAEPKVVTQQDVPHVEEQPKTTETESSEEDDDFPW